MPANKHNAKALDALMMMRLFMNIPILNTFMGLFLITLLSSSISTPSMAEVLDSSGPKTMKGFTTFSLGDIPQTPLRNQDNQAILFDKSWLGDGKVIINFVFTDCSTICNPMGAIFGQL